VPAPAPASSFVGRAGELADLAALLARERLVTVVGPGGCGKTRLTIEAVRGRPRGLQRGDTAATQSEECHPAAIPGAARLHGFVELAAAGPATDLARAALNACGLPEEPGRAPLDQLVELGDGLLVLDNCEHLRREVAALVDTLLRRCPALRILATSRVTLGLAGEAVLALVGLEPADAVALFYDRARRIQPGLGAADAVAGEICALADGLPLAVELAAAHARALPLVDIRDGMADRMRFLAARDPTGLPRHRSVASSLDWSAELVGEPARAALAALSVVDGRFPAEVALALTQRSALETLVDHSLVQFDAAEGRYLLLETIREYAGRLLAASGEGTAVHRRLLDWAVGFAKEVRDGLERAAPDVLRRVDAADAAIASALAWPVVAGQGRQEAAAVAVDIAFAWSLRGRCAGGLAQVRRLAAVFDPVPPALAWAEAFLMAYSGEMEPAVAIAAEAAEAATDDRTRARALTLVGTVMQLVDPVGTEPGLLEATELAERAGDDWCRVESLQVLAYCRATRSDLAGATAAVDAALPALARLGHVQLRAWDAGIRAEIAVAAGRFGEAVERGGEGLRLAVAVGEPVSAMGALHPLVGALVATGEVDAARAVVIEHREFFATHPGIGVAESLLLAAAQAGEGSPAAAYAATSALGVWWVAAEAADLLARHLLAAGDAAGAVAATMEALETTGAVGLRGHACRLRVTRAAANRALGEGDPVEAAHAALAEAAELGLRPVVVDGLDLLAALTADGERAGRLAGAAAALRAELGAVPSGLVELVPPDDEGARMGWERAVEYAARSRGRRARPRSGWESLTPTEGEVVALAAQGLSNAAIGAQLLVSPGTVRTHLRSVFGKLGVTSRAELAAQAARRGL
jgi:predicted ATPase/DNA-binding CsgD family transcriptional regulator